jgi:flagellar hook-associated protein 1 FlgK
MSLEGALSIAAGGLANINRQLALVSHNVANANTPGYAAEIGSQQSATAGGVGLGVRTGAAMRDIDAAMQAASFQQASTVAGLQRRQSALSAIDAVQGTPGQGSDLASLVGALRDQFSALMNDPSSQVQQSRVVSTASSLAAQINALSAAYAGQRQAAQNDITTDANAINTALGTIGSLSSQIVIAKSGGQSTADLENQRDAVMQSLSQIVDVRFFEQPNGDMTVATPSGLSLPTRAQNGPLQASGATVAAGAYYPGGGIPPITLNGVDATRQLQGGRIGAELTLRDQILPTWQAELDEFTQGLATRFAGQGLALFTDPAGSVPAGSGSPVQASYTGFAGTIQVNPAAAANPALVRDGTNAVAGSATGPSAFTPNPPSGPAGFSTLISRITNCALGTEAQSGVPQPPFNTAGLGPDGTLAAPFASPASLQDFASALIGSQAQDSASTTGKLATEQSVQIALQAKIGARSGVNMDAEMSTMIQLQNAFTANARVIAAVQAMWTQLLNAVQ